MTDTAAPSPRARRVVIIGAGFAGLAAAKGLAGQPFAVTIIDRHNYHLFQPLLYQVATAGLSPADIASPIRSILRDQDNASVMLAEVSGIDLARRRVRAEGRCIPYDILILATGAQHAYFGHQEWEQYAPGLKTVDDATAIRRNILLAFERAEIATSAAERARQLTFVVVGGGPTGVEMAGAIAELARRALAWDFRQIDPRKSRIVLAEAGPRLLASFDPALSEKAAQALTRLGVEVRCNDAVTDCSADHVQLAHERIDTATVVWAAGVQASPVGPWLAFDTDSAGRVPVAPDLSVPGRPDVFVLGDAALVLDDDGRQLPGVGAVAKQQGEYVAKAIVARAGGRAVPSFRYRDYGSLATIGRGRAVAEIGGLKLSGYIAWLVWSVAHIYFLIGFRRRLAVAANWTWSYFSHARGSRLITGITGNQWRRGNTRNAPATACDQEVLEPKAAAMAPQRRPAAGRPAETSAADD